MMTDIYNPLDLNDQSSSGGGKSGYSVTTQPLQFNTYKASALGPPEPNLGQKSRHKPLARSRGTQPPGETEGTYPPAWEGAG